MGANLTRRAPCAEIGKEGLNTNCAWQESKLSVLWTIGVFALNFGPVIVGPVLDYVGPKLTAILGEHDSKSWSSRNSSSSHYCTMSSGSDGAIPAIIAVQTGDVQFLEVGGMLTCLQKVLALTAPGNMRVVCIP
jgi:hypothetical protein